MATGHERKPTRPEPAAPMTRECRGTHQQHLLGDLPAKSQSVSRTERTDQVVLSADDAVGVAHYEVHRERGAAWVAVDVWHVGFEEDGIAGLESVTGFSHQKLQF